MSAARSPTVAELLQSFAEKIEDLERDLVGGVTTVIKGAPAVRVPPTEYEVNVYDRCGLYHNAGGCNWQTALVLYDSLRKQFPDKVVRVENPDRVDLGCADGLTEQERDELDSVTVPRNAARRAAPINERCDSIAKDTELGREGEDPEGPAGGLDLGGTPGCAGGLCEEERDHGND